MNEQAVVRRTLAAVLVSLRGHWDRLHGEQMRDELEAKCDLTEEYDAKRYGLLLAAQEVTAQLYGVRWSVEAVRGDLDANMADKEAVLVAALREYDALRKNDRQWWRDRENPDVPDRPLRLPYWV